MFSQRFHREIYVTAHAQQRMVDRHIDEARLLDLIESGEVHHKDDIRLWILKNYQDRRDNLLCAAVVLETVLIVKTVMHHFEIK